MRGRAVIAAVVTAGILTGVLAASAAAAPLDVAILAGPANGSTETSSSATFEFTVDDRRATVTCALDFAPAAPCRSPLTYSGLVDGPHTFVVSASVTGPRGVPETAQARRGWTVSLPTGSGGPGSPPGTGPGPGAGPAGGAPPSGPLPPAPLPPRGDLDGDGVRNSRDACSGTPRGARSAVGGCAAVEIVADPGILVGPASRAAGAAADGLAAQDLWKGARGPLAGRLRVARSRLSAGSALLEAGRVGPAAAALDGAAQAFDRLVPQAAAEVLRLRRALTAQIAAGEGDADIKDVAFQELGYRLMLIDTARRAARRASGQARALAKTQTPLTGRRATGRVVETDDASGTIRLADGRTFITVGARPGTAKVGQTVDLEGTAFPGKGGVVTSIAPDEDTAQAPDELPEAVLGCMFLRIAPFQPFLPPLDLKKVVMHNPNAYSVGGVLQLESPMRLAALLAGGCPAKAGSGPKARTYRYSLRLEYRRVGSPVFALVAPDLTEKDVPAELPALALPSGKKATQGGTLRATVQMQQCTSLGFCSAAAVIRTDDFPIRVHRRAALATVFYASTLFNLEDHESGVRVGQVSGLTLSPAIAGVATRLEAQGRSFINPDFDLAVHYEAGGSSQPFFAVTHEDFGDQHVFPLAAVGTDKRSGLAWPRAVGTRNGHTFWYSAQLPDIVRDRIEACPAPDAYYRTPWKSGVTKNTGQGNNTTFSHFGSQAFAFDFGLGTGETIRAARGGVVEWLQEGQTANFNVNQAVSPSNQPFPMGSLQNWGNTVRIGHQDGTTGWYFHLKANGVKVDVGDVVQRGQPIATADNTGRSTGPHLHFQVQADSTNWGQSIQIRFAPGCAIPQTNDDLVSANANPLFP